MGLESAFVLPNKDKSKIVKPGNYHFFYGGPYSQWAASDIHFMGYHFNTAEQFMMLGKAVVSEDAETADMIMAAESPREQKALGRKVKNYDEATWGYVRYDIVLLGNFLKFAQNKAYHDHLVRNEDPTVELFVEASPTDKIWGIGLSEFDAQGTTPDQWKGENLLGKVVTEVRDLIIFGHVGPGATFAKLDHGYAQMYEGMKRCSMI